MVVVNNLRAKVAWLDITIGSGIYLGCFQQKDIDTQIEVKIYRFRRGLSVKLRLMGSSP
jgi:hypothetical protein